jgi:hypothetical protein
MNLAEGQGPEVAAFLNDRNGSFQHGHLGRADLLAMGLAVDVHGQGVQIATRPRLAVLDDGPVGVVGVNVNERLPHQLLRRLDALVIEHAEEGQVVVATVAAGDRLNPHGHEREARDLRGHPATMATEDVVVRGDDDRLLDPPLADAVGQGLRGGIVREDGGVEEIVLGRGQQLGEALVLKADMSAFALRPPLGRVIQLQLAQHRFLSCSGCSDVRVRGHPRLRGSRFARAGLIR